MHRSRPSDALPSNRRTDLQLLLVLCALYLFDETLCFLDAEKEIRAHRALASVRCRDDSRILAQSSAFRLHNMLYLRGGNTEIGTGDGMYSSEMVDDSDINELDEMSLHVSELDISDGVPSHASANHTPTDPALIAERYWALPGAMLVHVVARHRK